MTTARKLRVAAAILLIAAIYTAAIALMFTYEAGVMPKLVFLATWALLNFFWIVLLRRAMPAGVLALAIAVLVVLLSKFKYDALNMAATVFEVMVIDHETFSFLLATFPDLGQQIIAITLGAVMAAALLWWLDPLRIGLRTALLGCTLSLAALVGLSIAFPIVHEELFVGNNQLSIFARSGAVAVVDFVTRGVLEADAKTTDEVTLADEDECQPAGKLPHIIMILDESGFDATMMAGTRVVPDYKRRFRSFDGKSRQLIVEGSGGPTWFTEYNVLSGLSVRSYGRFAEGVTRIAAGHVERGLPHALRRCGYRTFSIYPAMGAFLGARSYHTSTGIDRFYDQKDLGTIYREEDNYYYQFALRQFTWERGRGPLFFLIYTMGNHMPWNVRWRLDRTPDWRDTGQLLEIDEYLRRQEMSARDYATLLNSLKSNYPGEPFLVVRFGDHQPTFARNFIDPKASPTELARQLKNYDPRYFTTYYAIDVVNFSPADLSSALDTLEAPHLPLVLLEAAGVPIDASFAEQKNILQRCQGLFYRCNDGAEARRFNRLLIDAGLIKGL